MPMEKPRKEMHPKIGCIHVSATVRHPYDLLDVPFAAKDIPALTSNNSQGEGDILREKKEMNTPCFSPHFV